jgi:RNA polymerase sigma factor (sigma-70 family)
MELLLERHRVVLCALCRRMLRDPAIAEEIVQEAMVQAWLSLDRLRQPERFGPWLAGIGLNLCRRHMGRRRPPSYSWEQICRSQDLATGDRADNPVDRLEAAEMAARVQEAVSSLPAGQRSAVLLFYLQGLTHAETAATLGIPTGAVKTRLHKARRSLRRRLLPVWKENMMSTQIDDRPVEMRVADVRRPPVEEGRQAQYIVVLEELDGPRRIAIWVGQPEAVGLAVQLTGAQAPRPMTFTLMANLLDALSVPVEEIRITRLADEVFYAVVVLNGPDGRKEVDARPSDAMNLALAAGAPIRVDPVVLEQIATDDPSFGAPSQGTEDASAIAQSLRVIWRQKP